MYATKHSLKMLSHLTNLRCLKLYCRGRMPFTNPGKLGFFLDQQEQCVDYLFSSGSLEYLALFEILFPNKCQIIFIEPYLITNEILY